MSGGKPVRVGDSNLWGMEIDVAAAAEEIRNIGKADKGKGVEDVLGSFGLGAFADQLKDLRLSKRRFPSGHGLFLCFQLHLLNQLAICPATSLLLILRVEGRPAVSLLFPAYIYLDAKSLLISSRLTLEVEQQHSSIKYIGLLCLIAQVSYVTISPCPMFHHTALAFVQHICTHHLSDITHRALQNTLPT